MNRLYQWFSRRASVFHAEKSGEGPSRAIRTEVTVEWKSTTFLVARSPVVFDACPLCGHKLSPHQVEQARLRVQKKGMHLPAVRAALSETTKAPAGPTGQNRDTPAPSCRNNLYPRRSI